MPVLCSAWRCVPDGFSGFSSSRVVLSCELLGLLFMFSSLSHLCASVWHEGEMYVFSRACMFEHMHAVLHYSLYF